MYLGFAFYLHIFIWLHLLFLVFSVLAKKSAARNISHMTKFFVE